MLDILLVYLIAATISIIFISLGGCSKLECLEKKIKKHGDEKWKV